MLSDRISIERLIKDHVPSAFAAFENRWIFSTSWCLAPSRRKNGSGKMKNEMYLGRWNDDDDDKTIQCSNVHRNDFDKLATNMVAVGLFTLS